MLIIPQQNRTYYRGWYLMLWGIIPYFLVGGTSCHRKWHMIWWMVPFVMGSTFFLFLFFWRAQFLISKPNPMWIVKLGVYVSTYALYVKHQYEQHFHFSTETNLLQRFFIPLLGHAIWKILFVIFQLTFHHQVNGKQKLLSVLRFCFSLPTIFSTYYSPLIDSLFTKEGNKK